MKAAQTGQGTAFWVEVTYRVISVAVSSRCQELSWSEGVSGKKREKTVVASLYEHSQPYLYKDINDINRHPDGSLEPHHQQWPRAECGFSWLFAGCWHQM